MDFSTPTEQMPPLVRFEQRFFDRNGESVCVDYAIVTPAGSADRIENEADLWLERLQAQVNSDRMPAAWFAHFKKSFESWKQGQEIPEDGTHLAVWGGANPPQMAALKAMGINTVERVADMNEEALRKVGMGGQLLRQRARDFMAAKTGPGALMKEIEALKASMAALLVRNESLEAQQKAAKKG